MLYQPERDNPDGENSTDLMAMDGEAWASLLAYEQEQAAEQASSWLHARLGALGIFDEPKYFSSDYDLGSRQQVVSWPERLSFSRADHQAIIVVNDETSPEVYESHTRHMTARAFWIDAEDALIAALPPATMHRNMQDDSGWVGDGGTPATRVSKRDGLVRVSGWDTRAFTLECIARKREASVLRPLIRFDASTRYKDAANLILTHLNRIDCRADQPDEPFRIVKVPVVRP